jgi:Flp pilus assembly protein TadG
MSHQSDTCLGVREQRRATHRIARRRERLRRHMQKGQTLVIFVLSFTVLLGLAGLTIDVARAYDLYGRMQRAAEAGALAGVLYMPLNYTANYSDGNNAVKRALQETVKNGFGASVLAGLPATLSGSYFSCPNPPTSFEVAVCQSPTNSSDLQVYVTQTLNLVLLNGLGVAPITLRAVAQAEYAPPVQIAARSNYIGDRIECSPGNSENTNSSYCSSATNGNPNRLQYYFASMSGPSQLQESGDPYVYCSEGPSQINTGANVLGVDANAGSDTITTYNGYRTDHPQQTGLVRGSNISQYCGKPSPGGNPGNPDYQPDGYSSNATQGTVHEGGYNYQMNVQSGTGNVNLWIYNPFFTPGVSQGPDYFVDNGASARDFYRGPTGDGIMSFDGVHYDSPYFYFTTVVTVYSMPSLYDRTRDAQIHQAVFYPLDAVPADLSLHGCASGQVLDVLGAYTGDGGLVNANSYHNAVAITPGTGCIDPSTKAALACAAATSSTLSNWCKMTDVDPTNPTTVGPVVSLPDGSSSPSGFVSYRVVVEAVGLGSTALTGIKNTGAATNPADPRGYDYNVTTTSGYGQHNYALKACLASSTSAYGSGGCGIGAKGAGKFNQPYVTFYGINNMNEAFSQSLGTLTPNKNYPQASCVTSAATPYACSDLACIPTEFAGRTVSLRVYDPGDAPGAGVDMYLAIVPPDPTTATVDYKAGYGGATAPIQTATFDGVLAVRTRYGSSYDGYRPFNGLWYNVAITFAPNYIGDCALSTDLRNAPGWWQLAWISPNATSAGNPSLDSTTISLTTIGSPQHLVAVH